MPRIKNRKLSAEAKKKILDIEFEELIAHHPNLREKASRRPDWKRYTDSGNSIRCQSAIAGGVNNNQCTNPAMHGKLVCRKHNSGAAKTALVLKKELQQYGLYQGTNIRVLKREMADLENMPREKMYTLNDEVRLLVGVARKYLANTTDEQIAKRPYTLIYLMQNILAMKEANHNMIHSPKVVFTREQVEYLFMKVRMAIMSVVKDPIQLEQVQIELQKIAIELKSEGWRM